MPISDFGDEHRWATFHNVKTGRIFELIPPEGEDLSRVKEYCSHHRGFYGYMRVVDGLLSRGTGLGVHDYPDCTWFDWYDDRVPPKEAARMCLEEAGAPSEIVQMYATA